MLSAPIGPSQVCARMGHEPGGHFCHHAGGPAQERRQHRGAELGGEVTQNPDRILGAPEQHFAQG